MGLTFATEAAYDEYLNKLQLPDNVYPMHYEVKLIVNTESSYPSHIGQVHIKINILSATSVLILNAKNLRINNFWSSLITDEETFIVVDFHKAKEENLAIYFKELVPPGKYTLRLKFRSISDYNFYQSKLYDEKTNSTSFGKDRWVNILFYFTFAY